MTNNAVSATEFKAKCLALLDEIEDHGRTITITRRGRPVATLGPAKKRWKSPKGAWAGRFVISSDIANADTSGQWEVLRSE